MNIYINLIDPNKCFSHLIGKEPKDGVDFLDALLTFIGKNFSGYEKIYLFNKNIYKKDGKILKNFDKIKLVYTDNFTYALKQLALLSEVSNDDVVITNIDWDYYLYSMLNVYLIDYRNLQCGMKKLDEKYFKSLFPGVDKEYILDYLILQVKNEDDSIGHKKTLFYLKKFKGISHLLENIDKIEEEKYKDLFIYQKEKLKYFLLLKNLFLTEKDICKNNKK